MLPCPRLRPLLWLLLVTIGALPTAGCARPTLRSVTVALTYRGQGAEVAVATQDQRQGVLSEVKVPTQLGVRRGPAGDRQAVHTATGEPLADELSLAICGTLARAGFRARRVLGSHIVAPATVERMLFKSGAPRAVMLTVSTWHHDRVTSGGLTYHLELKVFAAHGAVLARATQDGEAPRDVNPRAFLARQLGLLLGDPAVARALTR